MAGAEALQRLRAELAAKLAAGLPDAATPLAELRDLKERLRLVDEALSAEAVPRPRPWRTLLLPLALVAALASLAALIPMPSVPFSLEASAGSVALRFDRAGALGAQAIDGELQVDGFSRLESADTQLTKVASAQPLEGLGVRAAQLTLQKLSYRAGTTLRFEAGRDAARVIVHATQAPVLVNLQVGGKTHVEFAGAGRYQADYAVAEWLRLVAGDATQPDRAPPPMELRLPRSNVAQFAWSGLQPVAVQFVERQAGAGDSMAQFTSSLQEARVKLPATAGEIRLSAGDRLELGGLEVERCELVLGAVARLQLSGSARSLGTRSGAFERSLKPSVLAFAAHNHTLGLMWSAAALIWGAGAWLRKHFDAPG